jgi:iron-sulfur cluster protein
MRRAFDHLHKRRVAAYTTLEGVEALRRRVRETRLKTVRELETHLERLRRNVEAVGGHFYFAKSGEEAVRYIVELAKRRGVRTIVKSKSMVTEEIGLNHALEAAGFRVVETDLGERIVQLERSRPSHLLAPAIHLTREEIAELFTHHLGREVPPDPQAITRAARESLRNEFLSADMGITGANLVVVESGSIAIVTNEGNGRLVTALPPIHVAVTGMEKVVPTLRDALDQLALLARSATGQKLSTYITFTTGPSQGFDGGKEFHLIVIDNGRSRALEDQRFIEALACIRCSACFNTCPTYRVLGGHIFGHIYTGPIGIPWTALTHGLERAIEISPLCISCGLCEEACPIHINIPEMIMHIKAEDVRLNGMPRVHEVISNLEEMAEVASALAPLTNWLLRRGLVRLLMEKLMGIDRRRPLPPYHWETFKRWFEKRGRRPIEGAKGRVAYFVDVYANYNDPELGRAVVSILERNGYEVVVPPQRGAAFPLLMYGNFEKALPIMKYNVKHLAEAVREGALVVASEPTAAACLKKLYPYFLEGDEEAALVAQHTYDLFEFLAHLEDQGELDTRFHNTMKGSILYHQSCHARELWPQKPAVRLLQEMGYTVEPIPLIGCCGMAGTYGYKAGPEGYDVSMVVGEPLFEQVSREGVEFVATESSVCKIHIESATARRVIHPAKLLEEAYNRSQKLGSSP